MVQSVLDSFGSFGEGRPQWRLIFTISRKANMAHQRWARRSVVTLAFASLVLGVGACSKNSAHTPRTPAGDEVSQKESSATQVLAIPVATGAQNATAQITYKFNAVPLSKNYNIFVHFIDSNGQMSGLLQDDHQPNPPTSSWTGAISYTRTVNVPAGMAIGTYKVTIGLYDPVVWSERASLAMGPGVSEMSPGSGEYFVGTLQVTAGTNLPPMPPHPPDVGAPTGGTPGVQYGDPLPSTRYADDFAPSSYVMTFHDEFNAATLNKTTWINTYAWGTRSLEGNGEQECYLEGNVSLGSGNLKLSARKETVICPKHNKVFNYTSGMVNSMNAFTQKYGYFAMRAKMPAGKGYWPAFWLLPQSAQWPPEIDVLEVLGHDNTTAYQTLHYNDVTGAHKSFGAAVKTSDMGQSYKVYAVTWQPGLLIYTIDGVETSRVTTSFVPNEPFYILMNLAVGGYWPGNPDATTTFPQDMLVDWVRVYQGSGTGPAPTPTPTPAPTATPVPTPIPTPTPVPGLSVGIWSPSVNQNFALDFWTTLTAWANGAAYVEWFDGSTLVCRASSTATPYNCGWNTGLINRTVQLTVIATSSSGQQVSDRLWVTIGTGNATPTPTPAPTPVPTPAPTATPAPQPISVSVVFPANGQVFARRFWTTLTAAATGASQVTWYADGAAICTTSSAPYNCSYKTPNRSANIVLTATARSASGQTASKSVTITVR